VIPFQSNSPLEVIYWGKTTGLVIPFQSNSPLEVILTQWFTEVKTTVLVIPFQSNSSLEVIYWGNNYWAIASDTLSE
jgi:hypothetical protein